MRRIVCDTGPLLHLGEAGLLDILSKAGLILIPPAVFAELTQLDSKWKAGLPEWVQVQSLKPQFSEASAAWLLAGLLDPGEAQALALATQEQADWLLTDDAAARMIAGHQCFEVHGSLGVVLWAAATGHLGQPEAEEALEALSRSSLWLSPRVLTEARAALRQVFA